MIRAVQGWPVPGDRFADVVRAVTGTQVVLVAGAAAVVALWLTGARREALALAVLCLVLPFAQAGLKDLMDRPRPPAEVIRAGFTSPSFPSGHVMSPTVVYGAMLAFTLMSGRRRWWRWLVAAPIGVVLATTGWVSVYLGVHWPTDVLGGYLWGLVLVLPAVGLLSQRYRRAAKVDRS